MNEQTIFLAALEISDPAERAAYVEKACTGDPHLASQVHALLAAHERSGDFLDVPAYEQIAQPNDGTLNLESAEIGEQPVAKQNSLDTRAESNGDENNEGALNFLEPSTKPGSLGRLSHYEVLEILGQGGFGTVVRAFDEKLQRVVAIKIMSPQMAATSPPRKRFLREARASAKIRHENVVAIYDTQEQPIPYLVMEYIPGETLQHKLDRVGPFDVMETLRIGQQIATGLAAAHAEGLIHRDIKPANILLESGVGQKVKITDFGLARAADDASLTQSGMIAGTPMFMAPEQASGVTLDHRADLFSFGSVLYVMCSGRPPFRAATTLAVLKRVAEDTPRPIREIIPEVPQWLCDLVTKLHAKNPDDRFQSAREVADLFGRYLAELQAHGKVQHQPGAQATGPAQATPSLALRASGAETTILPATPTRGNRGWVAAAAAVVLMGLIGLALTEATGVTTVLQGTGIRIFSPEGTLIVEVDDPDVSVTIDGEEIVIKGAGVKEIRVRPGQYKVIASKDGKVVRQELVNVTRNGRQLVRITREIEPVAQGDADRKAAEWVLSIGGPVRINQDANWIRDAAELPKAAFQLKGIELKKNQQVSDTDLAKFKDCKNLAYLILTSTQVSDAGLAHFKDCKNLAHVNLGETNVSDIGLAHLRDCKKLKYVNLHGTRVSDAGLALFRDCNQLSSLGLMGTPLNGTGLAHLSDCKDLRSLDLRKTKVSAASIDELQKTLPLCKIQWDGSVIEPTANLDPERKAAEYVLSIGGMVQVSDQDSDITAAADLPLEPVRLASVDLLGNSRLTDAGLASFKDCQNLTSLWASNTPLSDAGLAHFKNCKGLTDVNLENTRVGDAGLAHLSDCKDLTRLYLHNTQVSDAGLVHLRDCKNLSYLHLRNTKVSDAGLAHLKHCTNLTGLGLDGTMVSDAGLANLKNCKDLTGLYLDRTPVSNVGLTYLKDCKNLTHVTLQKTQVTAAGIAELKKALPQCKIEWDGGVIEPATGPDPDRRAAEYMLSVGGTVKVSVAGKEVSIHKGKKLPAQLFQLQVAHAGKAATDAGLANFKGCKNLTVLGLGTNKNITDAGLVYFKDCHNLTHLDLRLTTIGDAGLAHFKDCKKITVLNLQVTKVTDAGLAHFKDCQNLAELNLDRTAVTDAGLAHFKGSKFLTHLNLNEGKKVGDAGLANFKDCKYMTVLVLMGTQVTDKGLAQLKNHKYLTYLSLRAAKNVTAAGLVHLKGCENLEVIHLGTQQITNEGLALLKDHKKLKVLVLSNTKVTDDALAELKNYQSLKELNLNFTPVGDAGLKHIGECRTLTILHLYSTQVGDAGLEHLMGMEELRILYLAKTKVTAAGVKKLATKLPKCKIIIGDLSEPDAAADPDRRAAEYVLSIGGWVRVNGQDREITAVAALPKDDFRLTAIHFRHYQKLTDVELAAFKDCKNLTHLDLVMCTKVTDAGLAHFKDCKNLTYLQLHGTKVTDAGLAHFKDCKNLTHLDPSGTLVSDTGLAHFKDCQKLTTLSLNNTKVSDSGLAYFKDCKNLAEIHLQGTTVGDTGLAYLKDCTKLKVLDLGGYAGSTKVTDAGLAYFKDCRDLTTLTLAGTKVSDAGLAHFKDCKKLTTLFLDGTKISDAGLAHFKDCQNLAFLYLRNTQVSDAGLAHFKDCLELRDLDVNKTLVSDKGLAHFKFKDRKRLVHVYLGNTQVSDAGLAHLKDCTVHTLHLENTQVSDAALADLVSLSNLTTLNLVNTRISLRGHEQLKAAMPKWAITWSETNRSVAESVLALGGTVEIGAPGKVGSRPIKAAADLPREYFQVRRVSLAGSAKPLDKLPEQLSWLRFPAIDRLERIELSGINVPDWDFLAPIHGLRDLTLAKAGLIDASLVKLTKLPALQRLVLDGNDIRGPGLTSLKDRPELIDLSLGCPSLTDLGAKNLAELKQLKRLSLAGSGVGDTGIKHLAGLTNLESLDLRKTKATKDAIAELHKALSKCKIEWDGGVIEPTKETGTAPMLQRRLDEVATPYHTPGGWARFQSLSARFEVAHF